MSTLSDHTRLNLMIRGFQVSRMIRLAADLEIADKLPQGECRSVADLAVLSAVQATPLLRVLRALSSFGIFCVDAAGSVAHTPLSLLLRADAERSLRPAAVTLAARGSWGAWSDLDAAMHDAVPHRKAWGTSRFEYLRDHPVEGRNFDALMGCAPDNRHEAVAVAYAFSAAVLIADIGGGNGALLRKILERNPTARGIVFDREDVIAAIAPNLLEGSRIEAVAGDFFAEVPAGANIYLLVRVLHDWPDDDCIRILRTCRKAMNAGSRVLIIEQILEPDPAKGEPMDYLSDMQMTATFGSARERTLDEFAELLNAAGFELTRVIPTASPACIVEARPNVEEPAT